MNLRNNQITVGEILQNPNATAMLRREMPQLFRNSFMLNAARNMTLAQIINKSHGYVPQPTIQRVLAQLEQI